MVGAAQHRVALPIKTVDPFYVRPEWRAFALEVKKQRSYTCEDCGKRDWSVHADHINELRDGGEPFDPLNVRIRCHACHNRKTAKAKGARLSAG
jgi:5-methylcytosine-specific restriction enzyme A